MSSSSCPPSPLTLPDLSSDLGRGSSSTSSSPNSLSSSLSLLFPLPTVEENTSDLNPHSRPFDPKKASSGRNSSSSSSQSSGLGMSDSMASNSPTNNFELEFRKIWGEDISNNNVMKEDDFGLKGLLKSVSGMSSHTRGYSEADLGFGQANLRRAFNVEEKDEVWSTPSPLTSLRKRSATHYRLGRPQSPQRYLHKHLQSALAEDDASVMTTPRSEMTHEMPAEYRVFENLDPDSHGQPRLQHPEEPHWSTDLLFYLFYTAVGDAMQLYAASKLYDKGWRFSKANKIWLARYPYQAPIYRTNECESGIFQYFDPSTWSRVSAQVTVTYEDLESKVEPPRGTETMLLGYMQRKRMNAHAQKQMSTFNERSHHQQQQQQHYAQQQQHQERLRQQSMLQQQQFHHQQQQNAYHGGSGRQFGYGMQQQQMGYTTMRNF